MPGAALLALLSVTAVDFDRDVRPILSEHCFRCHGPDAAARKAGLRLDTRAGATAELDGSHAVVPGDPQASALYQRIVHADPDEKMPPAKIGKPLAPAQIEVLRQWIAEGAPWQAHWSFVPPRRPAPPPTEGPWPRNDLDRFVLARLRPAGLAPSPEADRRTLIRRVTLDLTGLPPTPAEADAFAADRSPRAYEKVVERLLASPHHGERWARPWLDLARYADTDGYEADKRRTIWKYRDWVIGALNRDLPFDAFTLQQLAGDLLPGAAKETLVATGFHRNTMFNQEAGVDPEESLYEVLVDRVNTTATVWLGATLGCAQCHDHKYDPFSQKDYFRLYAIFAGADYRATGKKGSSFERFIEPVLELPTPEQERRRKALRAELEALEKQVAERLPTLGPARVAWEAEVLASAGAFTVVAPEKAASTGGSSLQRLPDGSVLASGENPIEDTYVVEADTDLRDLTALRIEALPDERLPKGGPGRDVHGNCFLNGVELRVRPRDGSAPPATVAWKEAAADDHGYDVYGQFEARNLLDRPERGWSVDGLNDVRRLPRSVVLVAARPFGFPGGTRLELRLRQASRDGRQGLGRFRISLTSSPAPTTIVSIKARLRALLDLPEAERPPAEQAALVKHHESIAPSLAPLRKAIADRKQAISDLKIVTTLVLGEKKSPEAPSAHLRIRGAFLDKGERVTGGVPAVLPSLSDGERPDRLALARWLVAPENPLTARVTVNRIWEQYFGKGLVETSEDFGTQGTRPTHPELLDWLATELVARKWSLKALHRLIVTSATYRQSSRATPVLLEKDPYNKLLARGPRFRLEGEMIRDVSLAAAGLLSRKVGGPSVFPYQPDGVWDLPYNTDRWQMSDGNDRYRRGLYTFWRRTSPYPAMMTFDANSREVCSVKRIRTNTPLQALTTLNDPAFFDAARALARRMAREAGGDPRRRIARGFRLAATRAPKGDETRELLALYERERQRLRADAAAARAVMGGEGTADLAAWTVVANVILNLDEVLNKN